MQEIGNDDIAAAFEEVAALLEQQKANPFRVDAYRRAAFTLRRAPPVIAILEREGTEGLERLSGIGETLARSIREMLHTGRLAMLDRLHGEHDPEAILASVPGIGHTWAERLHHDLGLDSLPALEAAAWDGRLESLPRFGPKRLEGVRAALAQRLGRRQAAPRGGGKPPPPRRADPPIADLLDVDREYRERAARGDLPRITPRRFNPTGLRWLPVLHTSRSGRDYTALFSNTERAHRLGKTSDWVVVYYDGQGAEGQATIVTAHAGPLRGQRVVRGRENEQRPHR